MCSQQWCCCEGECCLKAGTPQLRCICCDCRCAEKFVCCKVQQQTCCLVNAVSFPPDNEVPCMCSMCFLTCYPMCKCCGKLGVIVPEFVPPPPRYLVMMNPQMMQQQQMMMQQQMMQMQQMQQPGMQAMA